MMSISNWLSARVLYPVLLLIISLVSLPIENAKAQYLPGYGFSGIMTMDELPPDFFANQVLPAAVMTNYAANPLTKDCALSFLGVTCFGKLDGISCIFKSENCDGPVGWNCYVYQRASSDGAEIVYGVKCRFGGDHANRLSFSYSGSSNPDLTDSRIDIQ